MKLLLILVAALCLTGTLAAQQSKPPVPASPDPLQEPEYKVPKVVPVPPLPGSRPGRPAPPPKEPTSPSAQTVVDPRAHLSFHLPPGWALSHRDGELSTFHLDARTATKATQLREVATLTFNPFPMSTFAGALFYVSETPHATEATCASAVEGKPARRLPPLKVAARSFHRGLDEHGHICTEARVLTYGTLRGHSCLRFDLAVNTFCGGEDSGALDMTDVQLAAVFRRLEGILDTVQFADKPATQR